jgi:hypothetical protein
MVPMESESDTSVGPVMIKVAEAVRVSEPPPFPEIVNA